jgi:hypothetical protein
VFFAPARHAAHTHPSGNLAPEGPTAVQPSDAAFLGYVALAAVPVAMVWWLVKHPPAARNPEPSARVAHVLALRRAWLDAGGEPRRRNQAAYDAAARDLTPREHDELLNELAARRARR